MVDALGGHKSALAALRAPLFLTVPKYQVQQSLANRVGADPDILDFERRLVARLKKMDIPVYAHCVVRTEDEQLRLLNEGKTKDSPLDGRWPHMAYAVDIVHGVHHWEIPSSAWAIIGHVGKEVAASCGVKVDWGGDWKFYDPAHWQLSDWKDRIAFGQQMEADGAPGWFGRYKRSLAAS